MFELSATTNCAFVGDVVRFTLVVTSLSDEPVRLTSDPLLEIQLSAIRRTLDPIPSQFWSETAQYPPQIDPVLQPGERRLYTWEWVAEPVYGEPGAMGVSLFAASTFERQGFDQGISATISLGVERMDYPGSVEGQGLSCQTLINEAQK